MNSLSLSVEQLVGKMLGAYQVEQLLGHGNVNAVYLARHVLQRQAVMLTAFILPQQYTPQARERFRERFTQVASALRKLSHPRILPVYDFGEQLGYPYIVAPLVTTGSLAKMLKQQSRLTPTQALEILRQVAEGFDYAHEQGVVHGTLKSTNILLNSDQMVQIAGFGLANMLELRGMEPLQHPYEHLFSIARTFLGSPEYIAPEIVQGAPLDARADIYALGVMLFEMLSGKPPFSGSDPLTIALQHVEQPIPSLHTFCPELPPALDLVVQRALERDPAQRFPSAGKLVSAFERVLHVIDAAQLPVSQSLPGVNRNAATLPPEGSETFAAPEWLTGQLDKDQPVAQPSFPSYGKVPEATGKVPTLRIPTTPQPQEKAAGSGWEKLDSPEELNVDPFVWWSTTSMAAVQNVAEQQKPGTAPLGENTMLNNVAPTEVMKQPLQGNISTPPPDNKKQRAPDKGRRRTVALLAAGGVAVVGVLGVGGISLAQKLQNTRTQSQTASNMQAKATTAPSPTAAARSTATSKPNPTPTQKPKPTPSPTAQMNPTPTAQPSPTPRPGHTGTVIGSTSQVSNSSKTFTNPADGNKSLLIHLSNGNFVAFESACTHEGVTCYYDSGRQKIICPRHNAVFDPANNASVVSGPPPKPLPSVPVKVNADGTVTTG